MLGELSRLIRHRARTVVLQHLSIGFGMFTDSNHQERNLGLYTVVRNAGLF